MVKVSINGYEAPLTVWHIVELEDGVCNASPGIENPNKERIGRIEAQYGNSDFNSSLENPDSWD